MAYVTSGSGIIHELLDDEVIIANLDAGIYYSIRGTGIIIWQLLIEGYNLPAIETLFSDRYKNVPPLSPFVDRLLEENLLIAVERPKPLPVSLSWPAEFSPPLFERYDEMKNLLMLDPIHEVDEQGWPSRK